MCGNRNDDLLLKHRSTGWWMTHHHVPLVIGQLNVDTCCCCTGHRLFLFFPNRTEISPWFMMNSCGKMMKELRCQQSGIIFVCEEIWVPWLLYLEAWLLRSLLGGHHFCVVLGRRAAQRCSDHELCLRVPKQDSFSKPEILGNFP